MVVMVVKNSCDSIQPLLAAADRRAGHHGRYQATDDEWPPDSWVARLFVLSPLTCMAMWDTAVAASLAATLAMAAALPMGRPWSFSRAAWGWAGGRLRRRLELSLHDYWVIPEMPK